MFMLMSNTKHSMCPGGKRKQSCSDYGQDTTAQVSEKIDFLNAKFSREKNAMLLEYTHPN